MVRLHRGMKDMKERDCSEQVAMPPVGF